MKVFKDKVIRIKLPLSATKGLKYFNNNMKRGKSYILCPNSWTKYRRPYDGRRLTVDKFQQDYSIRVLIAYFPKAATSRMRNGSQLHEKPNTDGTATLFPCWSSSRGGCI